jgi:hypothetical protein
MGIRNIFMPFARFFRMVAIRFNAPRMEDQPLKNTPTKNICMPSGARRLRGG